MIKEAPILRVKQAGGAQPEMFRSLIHQLPAAPTAPFFPEPRTRIPVTVLYPLTIKPRETLDNNQPQLGNTLTKARKLCLNPISFTVERWI